MADQTIPLYRVNGDNYRAWGDNQQDGQTHWMLATHNPIEVIAEATISMERCRRRDLSGRSVFKVVSLAHCAIQYRIGRGRTVAIERTYSLGHKAAVRQIINAVTVHSWPIVLSNEIWLRCHAAGVDSAALFNAQNSNGSSPFHNCHEMLDLLETVQQNRR